MLSGITNNIIAFKAQTKQQPAIDRDHTVAILGSSKTKEQAPKNAPFIDMANQLAKKLVSLGYNVITGNGKGVVRAANEGAWSVNPDKSLAVYVKEFPADQNEDVVNVVKTVQTGADRTELFRHIAKHWIVFPGGPGSLEELSIGGECKYYGAEPAPEVTLVGKKFQKPLFDYLKNMNELGVARNADQVYNQADTVDEIIGNITGSKLDVVV